jgi:RluA family pseudouridine synthase
MVSAVTRITSAVGGVRRVKPYTHVFKSYAKKRWLGRRVVDVLAREFPAQMSASYLHEAMGASRLRINHLACKPTTVFQNGDLLEHEMVRTEPAVCAPPADQWIIFLTDELVVINKPATVPVHAAGRFHHNTVVSILADECEPLQPAGSDGLFVVHRLDRETSGLLILARTAPAARRVSEAFMAGMIQKRYVALVDGEFPAGVHVVDAALMQTVEGGVGTNTIRPDGKPAVTQFERLAYNRDERTSVVLCSPRTGRTHQIRVHLKWFGHPIANDALYGGSKAAASGSHNLLYSEPTALPAPADEDVEASELESAAIFLHAVDYRSAPGAAGKRWHYCAPLPSWAASITPQMVGDGYVEPPRWVPGAAEPEVEKASS